MMASDQLLFPLLSISRHRMEIDGDGVTSLVAGAGCPLACRYCINKRLLKEAVPEYVTAETLLDRVKVDDLYFRATGGGVTFGGGEALLHSNFISMFRSICPPEWKICAETSLAVPEELLIPAIDAVDEYIVDCKDMTEEIYRNYTGGDCSLFKKNLETLLRSVDPQKILVRVPGIPGYNSPKDQENSVQLLRAMGAERFDIFDYKVK